MEKETISEKEDELIAFIMQKSQQTGGLAEITMLTNYIENGAEAFKQKIIKKLIAHRQVRTQGLQGQISADKSQISQLLTKQQQYEEDIQQIENLKNFKRKVLK